MIKKTLKYVDIDGITREEDFYFNLTEAEVLELQVSRHGGFQESMQAIINSKDPREILGTIKEIILAAYGERAPQSRHFIKTPEFAEAFSHTEAYSTLFMDLFRNADKASEFFNGLVPKHLQEETAKEPRQPQDFQKKSNVVEMPKNENVTVPELEPASTTITREKANSMTRDELFDFLGKGGTLV